MKLKTKIGLGALAALVAVIVPVMTIAGWYPDRPLKKWEGPNTPGFDHVTFNSFYNTPGYGNETEFFDGKQTGQGAFKDNIPVQIGQEITLRTYVHNNADPSLNGAAYNQKGIARNTKVKVGLPTAVGTQMNAVSQISASNAQPGSVYDTVNFTSADGKPFKLTYVTGSAYASTRSVTQMKLSDTIVTNGALIGETAPDGNVPGCFEYTQYVVVKVKVEAAPLTISKKVGIPTKSFEEKVQANVGDRLYFKVDFKNTGSTMVDGVAISDQLPDKLEVIPGTVKLYNANFPNGTALSDTALFTKGGQGVGDYGAGINGYILYQVKLKSGAQGLLKNVACVRSTNIPYDTCDDAHVEPPQECKPGIPVGDPRCETPPPQECKPGIPLGDPRCDETPPTTPTTPTSPTLPDTGIESGLAGIVGMTALSASAHAYRKSKKALSEVTVSKNRK